MTQWTRGLGALALAAALAASAACTGDAEDGGDSAGADTPEAAETDILELLNESDRLVVELVAAENRLLEQCLEEDGFTVHDRFTIMDVGLYEAESLSLGNPTDGLFPEPDMAAKWGFGAWADTEEGMASSDYEAYQDALGTGEELSANPESGESGDFDEAIDNSGFDALSEADRYAWYAAYGGEAFAEGQFLSDEEIEERYRDENGIWVTPEPGGCLLEMIEALYGEPELVIDEANGTSSWSGRPESPEYEGSAWAEIVPDYRERVADEESAFVDCLIDRDRGAWEFSDEGEVYIWSYLAGVYSGEWTSPDGNDYGEGVPDPPSDLPSDFEGLREYEVGLAVDFVECGDESGFVAATAAEWEAVHLEYYESIEPELFTWQEEVRAALDRAQELLGA
ncbi:hypothetical protein [Glycomyces paridis]|uniref:hypothetical protein n=1 Tax=Glycomyces paridis TaxID=2126555 RepID=UPI00130507F6|nr:hypothetical protein [Glycomyces paridis]